MSPPRKPLTDIVSGVGDLPEAILDQFDAATAAEFGPLPNGTYACLAVAGGVTTAKTGNKGYTVEFKVIEGKFVNRRLWMTRYFTTDALPITKAVLRKFGIDSKAKLTQPFPANQMVFRVRVKVEKKGNGGERNEVTWLNLERVLKPDADPLTPLPEGGEG